MLAAAISGGRSAFAIASASENRPCRPTTSARFAAHAGLHSPHNGAPQRQLGTYQVFGKRIGQPRLDSTEGSSGTIRNAVA